MSESRDVVDEAPAPPEQYRGRVANAPKPRAESRSSPPGRAVRARFGQSATPWHLRRGRDRPARGHRNHRSVRGAVLAAVRASSGDRSWGQVWGFSRTFRAHRGRGSACNESRSVAGKSCKQARFLRLPPAARILHGKEGVDGSSPSEGSAKAPLMRGFRFRSTCRSPSLRWVWSPLWSPQVENASNTGARVPGSERAGASACPRSWRPYPRRTAGQAPPCSPPASPSSHFP